MLCIRAIALRLHLDQVCSGLPPSRLPLEQLGALSVVIQLG
jgi:hypothetical protein